ncbi:unnamed protein product, partial [Meganyctiphanes norvegica]
ALVLTNDLPPVADSDVTDIGDTNHTLLVKKESIIASSLQKANSSLHTALAKLQSGELMETLERTIQLTSFGGLTQLFNQLSGTTGTTGSLLFVLLLGWPALLG